MSVCVDARACVCVCVWGARVLFYLCFCVIFTFALPFFLLVFVRDFPFLINKKKGIIVTSIALVNQSNMSVFLSLVPWYLL